MFEGLAGVIAEVCDLDTDALSDGELSDTIVVLHTMLQQLEAATTGVTAKWDARRCWDSDHARSGAAWLAWKCRMEHGVARRRIRLGRALRTLPATEAAWLAGDITMTHVNVLARAHTERTAEAMARDEHQLVDAARTKWFSQFARIVAYWLQHADPDGAEQNAKRDYDNRRAHVSPSFGGIVFGDFRLDPLNGAAFLTVLNSIEHELFETDWATARAEHGPHATAEHLTRTPAQRRAIELRDRTCFHPTCDPEPDRLQVDHIQPWTANGPTTQTNGRLACGYHNRQRHRKT